MSEKKFRYVNPKPVRFGQATDRISQHSVPLYRCGPHVWNVGGQDDVCVYLLDTGEGLILIDTGYTESVFMVVHNIWKLGFNPEDIKKILLTHYHGDHVNGVASLVHISHAEVWLSREDERMHQLYSRADRHGMHTAPYTVTNFFDDNTPIVLGRFTIETKLTPGHAPGCTTFFFDDTDEETGKTYKCAVHGGLGIAYLRPDMLANQDQTEEAAHRFVRDCLELAERPVDINMPSHLNQADIDNNLPVDLNDYTWFVADYSWHDMLVNRAEAVKKFWPEVYPEYKNN
ncbi:MAG: MBL fold metallo-hydrolase [Solobacterium sp.]|nr:MBL fold metallo-hydrolase [Solobacterium sp.]